MCDGKGGEAYHKYAIYLAVKQSKTNLRRTQGVRRRNFYLSSGSGFLLEQRVQLTLSLSLRGA